MFRYFLIGIVLVTLQGCTLLYRNDYFAPSVESATYLDMDCPSYMGQLRGGLDEKLSGPDRIAVLTFMKSTFSVCSNTNENGQIISVGPVLPIIPMPISSDDSSHALVISFKHESKIDKLSIDTKNIYIEKDNGDILFPEKYEEEEYFCHASFHRRANHISEPYIPCHVYTFQFGADNKIELKYKIFINGLKLNDEILPNIEIIFNRYRATFFMVVGP